MFSFVKKIVACVFMKTKTSTYHYSNRADQEHIDSIFMDDYMFGDDALYQEISPCDSPNHIGDYDNFVKVPSFGHPRVSSLDTDSDVGKENNASWVKGDLSYCVSNYALHGLKKLYHLRYISNCALHGLKKSRSLLPIMNRVLSGVNPEEETEEEPKTANKIEIENEYDFCDKTTDLREHSKVVTKRQNVQDKEFDLMKNTQKVVWQRKGYEMDDLIKEYTRLFPMENTMVDLSKLSRYRKSMYS